MADYMERLISQLAGGQSEEDLERQRKLKEMQAKNVYAGSASDILASAFGPKTTAGATSSAQQNKLLQEAMGKQTGTSGLSQQLLGHALKQKRDDKAFERKKELAGMKAKEPKEYKANQWEAARFGARMKQADDVFAALDKKGYDRASYGAGLESYLTGIFPMGYSREQAQAERNFITASLRRESGAAIAASEFADAEKLYFPRAGDSPETVEQKRRARIAQQLGMQKEAGGAYDELLLAYDSAIGSGSDKKDEEGKPEMVAGKTPDLKDIKGSSLATELIKPEHARNILAIMAQHGIDRPTAEAVYRKKFLGGK